MHRGSQPTLLDRDKKQTRNKQPNQTRPAPNIPTPAPNFCSKRPHLHLGSPSFQKEMFFSSFFVEGCLRFNLTVERLAQPTTLAVSLPPATTDSRRLLTDSPTHKPNTHKTKQNKQTRLKRRSSSRRSRRPGSACDTCCGARSLISG
jgi:hypothetical protein